jgi:hypothetical protein
MCGNQQDDHVNFCNLCGSEMKAAEPVVKENKPANPLFGFLFKILSVFSAFFAVCSIATAGIYTRVSSSYSFKVTARLETEPVCAVFSLLLALAASAFAVLCFIRVLVKKEGKEALFNGIFRLVVSLLLFIFSIILCVNMG